MTIEKAISSLSADEKAEFLEHIREAVFHLASCWARKTVVGADLLNYLKSLGWQCEAGESYYFEMWDRGKKFRPSDAAILTAKELTARKAARAIQETK